MRSDEDWFQPLRTRQSLDRAIVSDRINRVEHGVLRLGAIVLTVLLVAGAFDWLGPAWLDALCLALSLVSLTLPVAFTVRVIFWSRWRLQDDEGYQGGV